MKAYDCCKDALKTAINGLQEAYVKTVRTIRLNGKDYQTDGNTGVVDLGTIETKPPTASEVSTDDDRNVQVAIDAIEDEIGSETASGSILYKVKANTDAISAETTARQNEDTQLASDIADNATAIANEATARSDADDTLQTAIDEINGSISKNASDIASNKTEIDANASALTTEISNRESADTALQTNIDAKQDKLTAGNGIAISDGNEISFSYELGQGMILLNNKIYRQGVRHSSTITIPANGTTNVRFYDLGFSDSDESNGIIVLRAGTSGIDPFDVEDLQYISYSVPQNNFISAGYESVDFYNSKSSDLTGNIIVYYFFTGQSSADIIWPVLSTNIQPRSSALAITGKQSALTETQLSAVNSGITADKITAYDAYANTINSNTNNLTAEISNRESADTTLQTNIDAKQDKLTAGNGISISDNTIGLNQTVGDNRYNSGTATINPLSSMTFNSQNYDASKTAAVWTVAVGKFTAGAYTDLYYMEDAYPNVLCTLYNGSDHPVSFTYIVTGYGYNNGNGLIFIPPKCTVASGNYPNILTQTEYAQLNTKQDKFTVGSNLTIANNNITANIIGWYDVGYLYTFENVTITLVKENFELGQYQYYVADDYTQGLTRIFTYGANKRVFCVSSQLNKSHALTGSFNIYKIENIDLGTSDMFKNLAIPGHTVSMILLSSYANITNAGTCYIGFSNSFETDDTDNLQGMAEITYDDNGNGTCLNPMYIITNSTIDTSITSISIYNNAVEIVGVV